MRDFIVYFITSMYHACSKMDKRAPKIDRCLWSLRELVQHFRRDSITIFCARCIDFFPLFRENLTRAEILENKIVLLSYDEFYMQDDVITRSLAMFDCAL